MSRGYIVIAQNNSTTDYLKQAYALALNLKATQTTVSSLTVCVDPATRDMIKPKHTKVFDNIVDIPWADEAENDEWKINNKWKYYYMTPYDETVILDTDMLFPTDVSHWWDIMSQRDVWATTKVRTYRGEVVNSDYYRKYFVANDLPNVYTAFFYFKQSDLASELFAMTEIIFQHWQRFFHRYMPKGKPDWLSGDVAFALAMQLLDIEQECTRENIDSVPTFIHMKSHIQEVRGAALAETWTESLPTYYNDCKNFKIGNFQQQLPFHYVEKEWLTDKMIKQMEDSYAG
ncbi:hypothetical protein N9I83_00100 [bacterium]|nr:hypothetical protein [bacterium]